jgi:hypothetical protein
MKSENLPKVEVEQYDPNLDAQDEDVLSGGNNRLTYILVGLIVALVLGYVMLPKGQGSGLASVTPTFMLDDAAVTATVPTAADSLAAGLKSSSAATEADEENDSKSAKKMVASKAVGQAVASTAASGAEVVTAAQAAPAAPEPVAAAPTPAAEPVAAAPTNTTLTGKIEDENGHPLVGATVLLKGSSKGTSTDANGNYSLEVPASADNTLIYGYGGYDDEVVHARNSQPVNVTLTPRAKTSKRRR